MRRFLYRVACRVERVQVLVAGCCRWLVDVPVGCFIHLMLSPIIAWYFLRYPTLSLREAASYSASVCGIRVCPERLFEIERKMNSIKGED